MKTDNVNQTQGTTSTSSPDEAENNSTLDVANIRELEELGESHEGIAANHSKVYINSGKQGSRWGTILLGRDKEGKLYYNATGPKKYALYGFGGIAIAAAIAAPAILAYRRGIISMPAFKMPAFKMPSLK